MANQLDSGRMASSSAESKAQLPGWPCFDADEIEAAEQVLLAAAGVNYWTGEEGRAFEHEFAAAAQSAYAVALANGTIALLNWRCVFSGDRPGRSCAHNQPRTFIASASCAISVGAIPVFADVDRDSQNVTSETLRAAITPRTRAIIAVHLAGWPCDMDPILDLARRIWSACHRRLRAGPWR